MIEAYEIVDMFARVDVDDSWSFAGKTRTDTAYITHGYHRYPAKFIPQIASRLIEQYSNLGDVVLDPFAGCGTTLVEAKMAGRRSIGTDINPVASLITSAKITPIKPLKLLQAFNELNYKIKSYDKLSIAPIPEHERIDYWFRPEEKQKLGFILNHINAIEDDELRTFFSCAFSNILKNCSIWLQKSNKPTRDMKKTPADPIAFFSRQAKAMMKGNKAFYDSLQERGFLAMDANFACTDARQIPTGDATVDLVVTSPPYVTSYEYADLHQLTTLWFEYAQDLSHFRKRFIGTSHHEDKALQLNSDLAESIQEELAQKYKKVAKEVATYFSEMNQVFVEMQRVLKPKGKICLVIGNTSLKGVKIHNAEVFVEQLQHLGFDVVDIIKREIPSKNLPSTRDKHTGRFTKTTDKNKVLAYPTEFILVMEKR